MNPPAVPPRFVPTLTDVVPQDTRTDPAKPVLRPDASAAAGPQREEQLVASVMQRVDMVFERRLREAVGKLILAQTEAVIPLLRTEIQGLVRDSVRQALAQEDASKQTGLE